jgi:heat shock protein HtpX
LGIDNVIISLIFGVALFAIPPLLAIAACLTAMAPLLSSNESSFYFLLKRQLLAESMMLIPLAIFITGSGAGMMGGSGGIVTGSLVLAYVTYRGLAWLNWSMNQGETVTLESGEVFERTMALARKAGVVLSRVSLIHTRIPEEANAFATSDDSIILTDSLVKGLTPRELDAVVAHELGHHKSGHLRIDSVNMLFWVYILVAGPLYGWLMARFQLPEWFITLPISPLLFLVAQGTLSQRREYAADARAVEITGDPEGTIAALGRLAQLSRIPVQSGGMMGSILSHPSMDTRVLTLARRFDVPEQRALTIVRNPDSAYRDRTFPAHTAPVEVPEPNPPSVPSVFGVRERALFLEQLNWLIMIVPLLGLTALTLAMPKFLLFRIWFLVLGVAMAVAVFWFMLRAEEWWSARFSSKLRRHLVTQLRPDAQTVFAGIHPGHGVICTDGFHDWDFGFIELKNDWLCYRGEKTRFAIPRQDISEVRVVKDRISWLREHRVQIVYRGGAFTLSTDFARPTYRAAFQTTRGLERWVADATSRRPLGPPPEPSPVFPPLPGLEISRLSVFFSGLFTAFKVLLGGVALFSVTYRLSIACSLVAFFGPLIVFVRFLPAMIWPIKRPAQPVEQTEAPNHWAPVKL